MDIAMERYGMGGRVNLGFAEALEKTRTALNAEGFGVLWEMDIQATLKAKLGVDQEPYTILGACTPGLAHRALATEADLGLLMPCNVVVCVRDGAVWVKAVEPGKLLSIAENPGLDPIVTEVRGQLQRALAAIGA